MGRMSELAAAVDIARDIATDGDGNPRAVIGGNSPPEPTPYEIASAAVDLIYGEALLWMDGATVDNQDLADGIGNLIAELRKAGKLADDNRKVEKKPHDDAAKAVQDQYKPLLDKIDRASTVCKTALGKWLAKVEAENAEKARVAREAADQARKAAEDAIRTRDAANLAQSEAAEALVAVAKKAERAASKAGNATANAGGMMGGRAIGLRTDYVAVMVDPVLAARGFWATHRPQVTEFMQGLADIEVRAGKRVLDGFRIDEEKKAV